MSLSIYDVAITPLLAGLSTLSRYLDKAEAYAAENKIDPAVLAGARLAPDMLPLAGQVQRASDSAKAERRICPPPSPAAPSIIIISVSPLRIRR